MEKETRSRRGLLWTTAVGVIVAGSLLAVPVANASDGPTPPRPPAPPPAPVAAIKICKTALGPGVAGSFEFTVRGGVPNRVSVPVGRCSAPIPVVVTEVVVREAPKVGIEVGSITATPPERLGWVYLEDGQGTVRVPAGGESTITFGNRAVRG